MTEVVLLVVREESWRPVVLYQPVNQIVERVHLDPNDPNRWTSRVWQWFNEERSPSGHRIFREAPYTMGADTAVATRPEDETPVFDEINIRVPLNREQAREWEEK